MTSELISQARLALLRAEHIEQQSESRDRAAASNHSREFINSPRLRQIRNALFAIGQIADSAPLSTTVEKGI